MDDAALVRVFKRLGDLFGHDECVVHMIQIRPSRDSLPKCRPFDQFHHQGEDAGRIFQAVNGGDVWVIQ